MKKAGIWLLIVLLCLPAGTVLCEEEAVLSPEREQTIASIEKVTDYESGMDLYTMEVSYAYDLDALTTAGPGSDEQMTEVIRTVAAPGTPITPISPNFGCTAFTLTAADGKVYMGRNYDFLHDTSVMLCYCHPEGGYASVSFCDLSHFGISDPLASRENRIACLAAPFVSMDGMNEKGVSVAVLALTGKPTMQDTGRPIMYSPVTVRLILDRAATTEEAVEILSRYDYYASSGIDCHFYITDASGNGVVVEWDCEKPERPMVVTPVRTVTNYFAMYESKFYPGQDVGKYGVGRVRRDRAEAVFESAGDSSCKQTAWDACVASACIPRSNAPGSYTQWTVVYDLTDLTGEVVLRHRWDDVIPFKLSRKENAGDNG